MVNEFANMINIHKLAQIFYRKIAHKIKVFDASLLMYNLLIFSVSKYSISLLKLMYAATVLRNLSLVSLPGTN